MQNSSAIIAVAGWEERFVLGLENDMRECNASEVVIVVFEEYAAETAANRSKISQTAAAGGIVYREIEVQRKSPANVWKTLQQSLMGPEWAGRKVLVDITTMPREVIWWTLDALLRAGSTVSYVYYRPGAYASEWVTRDTDRPRLVYQMSGLSEFGRSTCLVVVSGFDVDRVAQIIQFFEPAVILIGLQTGTQFENQVKNIERHKAMLVSSQNIRYFDLDAFSQDHGLASIDAATVDERSKYNIVAASLGPKLSAVALYHLQRRFPTLALAYAPSRQFNPGYSTGIGEPVSGVI